MKYKKLDGTLTPWKGEHYPLWKRLIFYLYKYFVNEIYIPSPVSVLVKNYPTVAKKSGIESIKIVRKRLNYYKHNQEHYIWNDFGNEVIQFP